MFRVIILSALLVGFSGISWSDQGDDGCIGNGGCENVANDLGEQTAHEITNAEWVTASKMQFDFQLDLSGLQLDEEMLVGELSRDYATSTFPQPGDEIIQLWVSPAGPFASHDFDLVMAYTEYDINGNPVIQGNQSASTIGQLHATINNLRMVFHEGRGTADGMLQTTIRNGKGGPVLFNMTAADQVLGGITPRTFALGILDVQGAWSGEIGFHAFIEPPCGVVFCY